jgi:hypothetical protein
MDAESLMEVDRLIAKLYECVRLARRLNEEKKPEPEKPIYVYTWAATQPLAGFEVPSDQEGFDPEDEPDTIEVHYGTPTLLLKKAIELERAKTLPNGSYHFPTIYDLRTANSIREKVYRVTKTLEPKS